MATVGKLRSWDAFSDWCQAHGLASAPAHPWTVAAYLRTVSTGMRLDILRRELGHIGTVHYEKLRTRPDRHPIVKRTLESLRREREEAKKPKVPALFKPDDFVPTEQPPAKAKSKTKAKAKTKTKGKAKGIAKGKAKEITKNKTVSAAPKKPKPKSRRGLSASPKLVRRKRV